MAAVSTPQLVIRLIPAASRAPSIGAMGLSLALHGGIVALAFGGFSQLVVPHSPPSARKPLVTARYVILEPEPRPLQAPTHANVGSGLMGAIGRTILHEAPATLDGDTRPLLATPRISASELNVAIEAEQYAALPAQGGVSTAAELQGKPGDACPEIRRPRGRTDARDELPVSVAFVVDTSGTIDPTTLKVVQAPGMPVLRTGFVPHIYAVGAAARIDQSLPHTAEAYGPIVADDVMKHVAHLRFRPGSRNGQPVQSAILISCQVS